MHNLDITFSNYFSERDVAEFNDLEISGLKMKSIHSKPLPKASGGLMWEGIIIFISGSIAAGFLGAIGQEGYKWFKRKLFEKKLKLKKSNIEKLTINVKVSRSMVFFHLTDLDSKNFEIALKKSEEAFLENKDYIEKNIGWYNFIFDTNSKQWMVSRNKSFDV